MTRTFTLIFICLFFNGCVEPYPGWTISVITQNEVPSQVMKSFRNEYPNATILKIERSIFESRNMGRPKLYRFHFKLENEKESVVILDEKGKPSNSDFWFHDTSHEPNL